MKPNMKTYEPIPKTVTGALRKWDSGESVFSVEMGGIGPGYEMAIQGLAFELMRKLKRFKLWDDEKENKALSEVLEPVISRCDKEPWGGFSGAQVRAAKSLAAIVCRKGTNGRR